MMHRTTLIGCLVVVTLLTNSCARKNRALFSFRQIDKPTLKKLSFPAPTLLAVQTDAQGTQIFWNPIDPEQIPKDAVLVGYNIYQLNNHFLIMHHPCNQTPITAVQYQDNNFTACGYCVRAIFSAHNTIILGPLSNIIYRGKKVPPT